jgi:FtsP/CotA-like multicopper oxidase with cupredoxin domain
MRSHARKLQPTGSRKSDLSHSWRFPPAARTAGSRSGVAAIAVVSAMLALQVAPASAQGENLPPTIPTVPCATQGEDLIMPPELVSAGGVLQGTIKLSEEFQRLPPPLNLTDKNCPAELVRTSRGEGLAPAPAAQPPDADFSDPIPAPTLRARVGDLVQLSFVNEINPNRFDLSLDIDACTEVGQAGAKYPGTRDKQPNCLHASSTSNIHFHGTHTNPNSTGDNVYLQLRPLPRDNQGNLTTTAEQVTESFAEFFANCADQLNDPLNSWPTRWSDLPPKYTALQTELLMAYQQKNPGQPIWDEDEKVLNIGWPQYYIGALPYCFALPEYTAEVWPPPPGSTSPNMGQAPGTHWYHAHKHGSTAINVMNGMTGALIIEGQYDDDLNAAYGEYMLEDGPWNTRSQPIMVLNQLGIEPNIIGGTTPRLFAVNGRLMPNVQMQPGEVQLWRIINTAGRSAAYFMAPDGLQWRQLAQDGVQLADQRYASSLNKPFYLAPGNRVDLLVQAPTTETATDILIQNVVARGQVVPTPLNPTDPKPGTPLMRVTVAGPPVQLNGQDSQMQFLGRAPDQPVFLADITDEELRQSNYSGVKLDFSSKARGSATQHTINGVQFEDGNAHVSVRLGDVQEWRIENSTGSNPGLIDHPFHIHINPFQITEVFDPNENLVDPDTGQLLGVLKGTKTVPVPKYVLEGDPITDPRQCVLKPDDPNTWKPCKPVKETGLIWWDVFAIPSGRPVTRTDGTKIVIPGYFTMRSRFVDYPGVYVLHCHILIHEDRGMMFSVEVTKPGPLLVRHH